MSPEDPMEERATLNRYGIVRVPADVFLVGDYRYSSLGDAIAAAKRNEARMSEMRRAIG